MKFLFDIFPILLFFAAYKFFGIFAATGVAMGASLLQVAYLVLARKKIEWTIWVNIAVIGIFGSLTLFLHNELFIKWKPTIIYAIFALGLFVSHTFFKKNLLRTMMQAAVELPEEKWLPLQYAWMSFFVFLACLNLVIAYTFSTDVWVNFKLFGLISLTVFFVIAQSIWISRFAKPKTEGESN